MDTRNLYRNAKSEITSRIAYLIGVKEQYFLAEGATLSHEIYQDLDKNTACQIVRCLCNLRTQVFSNYQKIYKDMNIHYRLFSNLEYLPSSDINRLEKENIIFNHNDIYEIQISLNKEINNRINNCKPYFPSWVKWDYIKGLFVIPNGLSKEGIVRASKEYYANRFHYPYQQFLCWNNLTEERNILYNDGVFLPLLYELHGDKFEDASKISDIGDFAKNNIHNFIKNSSRTVMLVDCENASPISVLSAIRGLDEEYTREIIKIMLFNDVNASKIWESLSDYVSIPIEHLMTQRIVMEKSLVDIQLTAGACKEHYTNNIDSFIVVSSDSDFWGLVSSLPDVKFLFMLEHGKTSKEIKNALSDSDIYYCFIDRFYSGDIGKIKETALVKELKRYLQQYVHINVDEMLHTIEDRVRVDLSEEERDSFMRKYVKTLEVSIGEEGFLTILPKLK